MEMFPGNSLAFLSVLIIRLLLSSDLVNGEAKFLSHVPYDLHDFHQPLFEDEYSNEDIHDSIIKLPGRIYPKLPYTIPDNTLNTNANNINSNPVRQTQDGLEPIPGPKTSPLRTNTGDGFSDISGFNRHYSPPIRQNDQESKRHPYGSPDSPTTTLVPPSSGGPRFDRNMSRNVTAMEGDTVDLICRVVDLGSLTVSWLRSVHVLAIGEFRYSTNRRISVRHNHGKDEWRLRIKGVTHDDAGPYECQISSFPVLSFVVDLIVSDGTEESFIPDKIDEVATPQTFLPVAELFISPSHQLVEGEVLNFTCLVTHKAGHTTHVSWFFEDQILHPSLTTFEESFQVGRPNGHGRTKMNPTHSDGVSEDTKSINQPLEVNLPTYVPRNAYSQSHNWREPSEGLSNNRRDISSNSVENFRQQSPYSSRVPTDGHQNGRGVTRTSFPLVVGTATMERAGKYACVPHGGKGAAVDVQVHPDEDVAAYSACKQQASHQIGVFFYLILNIFVLVISC